MNDLLFDQYQRYKNVADAIQSMRDGTSCLKILEVGANEHQNLEKFLPNDDIKYLDVELPERLLSNPNYFLGDATKMEFPDKSFDVVVALDVYEHIHASKRKSFISEINRVSSNFFIITAPFKSKRVSESEQRVNSIFKILFGHNFRWLEEHFENGLPEEQELEDVMNSLDVKFRKLNHGDLNIWETMMGIHFFAARIPQLITYREKIDQFYNNYLYEKDYTAESYRKIYIARKTEEFSLLITERSRINQDLTHDVDVKKLRDLRDVFFSISSLYQVDMTTCDHNTDVLQLFFDTGKGFNEKESLKVQHDLINEEKKYSLPINSNNQEVTSIRIDPSNFSGVYQVRDVRFYDTSNQKIELFKISGNYKCNIGKSYVFLEDDPHIIFDLDSSAHVKLVEFELITGSHSLQELIIENNKITSTKNDRILDLEEQLESIKDLLEERKNDLQLLQKTISEITLTVGYKDDQMDVLRKENSILSDRINEKELQLKNSLEEINSIYQTKGWRAIQFFKKIIGKQ